MGTSIVIRWLCVAPMLLPLAIRGGASSAFVATVANALTNEPIPDAEVWVTDVSRVARTNWIGEGVIGDIPRGQHHVRVRRLGFVQADIDVSFDRDTVGVFFSLSPRPVSLDTVKTAARMSLSPMLGEFEMRRRMGIGRFLTDSVLQADSTQPIATIIERRIPGLRAVDDGRRVVRVSAPPGGQSCRGFDTYIDGLRVSLAPDETDLRFFQGRDVAGIEYYTDVNAPVQFRHQTMACGVLLIWTRY
jgi:hypothetical protein